MTEIPPLAGGGGYTISLEEKHQRHTSTPTTQTTSSGRSWSGDPLDDRSREGGLKVGHVLVFIFQE